MPFDLNQFRNKLTNGGARPSQFEMRVTWPQIIPEGVAAAADFPFLCQTSELPPSDVGNISVGYFGRKLNFAGDRTFPTLAVTIINDEDFKIRRAFEAWSAAITGHSTTTSRFNGGLGADSYATDAEVRQYSRNDNGQGGVPIKAYKYIGAWPQAISSIALDWNTNDSIETFTVTMQYQWWEPIDPASGAATPNF